MKDINYPIDYDMFTAAEVIKLINFYNMMLSADKYPYSKILQNYQEYRNIINSIALEKKYDALFEKETGISIYRTVHRKQDQ
jgi:uncharacterized protein YktA (UPF0223 family)